MVLFSRNLPPLLLTSSFSRSELSFLLFLKIARRLLAPVEMLDLLHIEVSERVRVENASQSAADFPALFVHHRALGQFAGEGERAVVHDTLQVVGQRGRTTVLDEVVAVLGLDVLPLDGDVLVAVRPRLFVMEAERVDELVLDNRVHLTAETQAEVLTAFNHESPHVRVASASVNDVDEVRIGADCLPESNTASSSL